GGRNFCWSGVVSIAFDVSAGSLPPMMSSACAAVPPVISPAEGCEPVSGPRGRWFKSSLPDCRRAVISLELFHVSRPLFSRFGSRGDTRGQTATPNRTREHGQRRDADAIQPVTQVAEIDVAVDVRGESRVAVPQNALCDHERHARPCEQSCRGAAQIMKT